MLRILIFLFLISYQTQAQVTFEKIWGGNKFDRAMFIDHTKDGGYILCGYTNSYSDHYDSYVAKLNDKGELQWQRVLEMKGFDMAWGISELNDGHFLLHGTKAVDSTNDDLYISMLNDTGAVLWQKTYGNHLKERAAQLMQLKDGNYLLIGQRTMQDGKDIKSYIIKLDTAFNPSWEYMSNDKFVQRSFYGVETPEGDYLISGLVLPYANNKADIWVQKIDRNGKHIFSRTYGNMNSHDIVHSMSMNSDGKTYTLTGYTESSTPEIHNALFMQIDVNGNLLTIKQHSTGNDTRLMHSEQTTDGGFIVTGFTTPKGIAKTDAVLLKYKANGEVEWLRTFGTPGTDDQGYWLVNNKDGGYTIAGYINDMGQTADIWVLRTNSNGRLQ
ncbi:MAG: hypothetical protein KGZ74_11345 [Chitinophagaceae bacterium]|nr:hypothetical protein [Chitinophagaceae bacterium]